MKRLLTHIAELLALWLVIGIALCAAAIILTVLSPSGAEQLSHHSKGAI
jgi:hypothetical protein